MVLKTAYSICFLRFYKMNRIVSIDVKFAFIVGFNVKKLKGCLKHLQTQDIIN